MVEWGYIPTKSKTKNIFYKLIGHPHPVGRLRANIVNRFIDKNAKITLDVGCGDGILCRELSKLGMSVYGLDISKTSIKRAKTNAEKINTPLSICIANARKIPYKKGIFDQVVCLDVLEHIKSFGDVLKQINFSIKTNGKLIITVPNKKYLTDPIIPVNFNEHLKEIGHVHKGFSHKQLEELLKKHGFFMKKHKYFHRGFSRIIIELIYWLGGPEKIRKTRKEMYQSCLSSMLLFCIIYPFMRITDLLKIQRGGFTAVIAVKVDKQSYSEK